MTTESSPFIPLLQVASRFGLITLIVPNKDGVEVIVRDTSVMEEPGMTKMRVLIPHSIINDQKTINILMSNSLSNLILGLDSSR